MLKRVQNWDTKALHEFLLARAQEPFAWGGNDCALFAADGVLAMTGTDIADDFRGKYADEASAWALINSVTGGETVADAAAYCAEKHGMVEWPNAKFAQRGDLVVYEQPGGIPSAGLVHLSGVHVVAVGEGGLFRMPLSVIKRAWHV